MISIVLLTLIQTFLFLTPDSFSETRVETFFDNTDHELTVYFINGNEPGKTLMIIGGIQGDEPGGYIAADLYADKSLEKGNLIVVPRANFLSIRKNNRGVNGDMNRKFAENNSTDTDYDSRIVEVLKNLMGKSDALLNLHEGSGFYYPEYVSDMKNPMRYGQCIIIDALKYRTGDGKLIDVEGPAQRVIAEMNQNIKNTDHHFHLSNHDTFSQGSAHKEQRGSATYNALTLMGIPGYGIETSKSIPSIETKVRYETLAINAFMKEYGIIPEDPSVYLPTPELEHLVITLAGNSNPYAVKNGSTIFVPVSSSLKVTSVVANYKRGISVDISGFGNTNDLNRETIIAKPTSIKVYKDAYQCGEVFIAIADGAEKDLAPHVHSPSLDHMKILVGDKIIVVSSGETLHIVKGDLIRVLDARTSGMMNTGIRVNFKGFVGNKSFNDAEDRGYVIDTGRDLMENYGIGNIYRVEATKGRDLIGSINIAIDSPSIEYVIIENGNGDKLALSPGETMPCVMTDSYTVLSVVSNIDENPGVTISTEDNNGRIKILKLPAKLNARDSKSLHFRRKNINLGTITLLVDGKT